MAFEQAGNQASGLSPQRGWHARVAPATRLVQPQGSQRPALAEICQRFLAGHVKVVQTPRAEPLERPSNRRSTVPNVVLAPAPTLGLILAAGRGSRLQSETGATRLKPLLQLAGKSLIARVIESMQRVGCHKVIIVTGFAGDELRSAIRESQAGGPELCFVHNPDFERSNGLSVWAAREQLTTTFILSMADHIVSPTIMALAASHRPAEGGATLLVDRKIESVFDLDDATKVVSKEGRIVSIGKGLPEYDCIDTGIFVGTRGLVQAIGEVVHSSGDASLSDGVQNLARRELMNVLDVGNAHWADVDTPEMLADAEARLVHHANLSE